MRLKPHAIDVRVSVDPIHWFLGDPSDTRSSYYLEDAATEFQVQGLEVDWACVTWDADLRLVDAGWRHHSFRGKVWENVNKPDRQRYLLNAYLSCPADASAAGDGNLSPARGPRRPDAAAEVL